MDTPNGTIFRHKLKVSTSIILVPVNDVKVLALVLRSCIKHCVQQAVNNTRLAREVLTKDANYAIEVCKINNVVLAVVKQVIKL